MVSVFGVKKDTSVNNSRTTHYFIYPRDKAGKRTGQTICILLHEGKMFHGISTCSEEDQFCKKTGREVALQRAERSVALYESRKEE